MVSVYSQEWLQYQSGHRIVLTEVNSSGTSLVTGSRLTAGNGSGTSLVTGSCLQRMDLRVVSIQGHVYTEWLWFQSGYMVQLAEGSGSGTSLVTWSCLERMNLISVW